MKLRVPLKKIKIFTLWSLPQTLLSFAKNCTQYFWGQRVGLYQILFLGNCVPTILGSDGQSCIHLLPISELLRSCDVTTAAPPPRWG